MKTTKCLKIAAAADRFIIAYNNAREAERKVGKGKWSIESEAAMAAQSKAEDELMFLVSASCG